MTRPNVIFIMIDDMGWKDLGCCGSDFYETLNIDRLAKEGMQFTNAYAACPVCSPTRASLMTGKYPAAVGVTDFIGGPPAKGKLIDAPYVDHLPLQEFSLPKAMKAGGYQTWHVGKWHLGTEDFYPEKQGFDVNIAGCHHGHPHHGYFSPWQIPTLEDGKDGDYLTDRLTDEAINLIETKNNQPFFLYMSYYAVHVPIQSKPELVKRFAEKAKIMGLDKVRTFEEGEYFPCEHKKDQRVTRRLVQSDPDYAAMVYNLDWNIGRLLESLEKNNLTDDTIVIFTSDNGGLSTAEGSPTCNLPLSEGKGWMYEGGTREPLIVKWPGTVKPASQIDAVVTTPDFYPTILEMAGLDLLPDQHKDGLSLLPILKQTGTLDRDAIYWHYPHYGNQGGTPGCSMRMGDYKLIEFFEDNRLELYNLKEDPGESRNLATEQPQLTEKMHNMLIAWREKINAKMPAPNRGYQPWQ